MEQQHRDEEADSSDRQYIIRKDELGWILLDTHAQPGTGRTTIHDSHDEAIHELNRRELVALAGDEFAVRYPAGELHPVFLVRIQDGQTTRWHNAGEAITYLLALRADAQRRALLTIQRDQARTIADVALDHANHLNAALAKVGA